MRFLLSLLLSTLLLLTGCRRDDILTVRTSYLNAERYASLYVDTPDPEAECPSVGQVLTVHWHIPLFFPCSENKMIVVRLRFGDTTHEEFEVDVDADRGLFVYKLMDDEYFSKKGIISYHIALYADGELVSVEQHQLWAEVIDLGEQ